MTGGRKGIDTQDLGAIAGILISIYGAWQLFPASAYIAVGLLLVRLSLRR